MICPHLPEGFEGSWRDLPIPRIPLRDLPSPRMMKIGPWSKIDADDETAAGIQSDMRTRHVKSAAGIQSDMRMELMELSKLKESMELMRMIKFIKMGGRYSKRHGRFSNHILMEKGPCLRR